MGEAIVNLLVTDSRQINMKKKKIYIDVGGNFLRSSTFKCQNVFENHSILTLICTPVDL